MFVMIKNLTKAAIAVAVSPVDAVVDIVTAPESAYNNKPFFNRTEKRLQQAADAMDAALKTDEEENHG